MFRQTLLNGDAEGCRECDLAALPAIDERVGEPGVELRARTSLQLGERRRDRERRAIRTDRGHRVERIRDPEHTRLERNRVTLEAMRVAGAVPTLVVMEHSRYCGQEVVEALHKPRARNRVPPNLIELFLGQRAWLAKYGRFDRDLADVVERATEPERLEPPARPAQGQRESLCERSYPGRVAAKVRIPRLKGGREGGKQGPHSARVPERMPVPFLLA